MIDPALLEAETKRVIAEALAEDLREAGDLTTTTTISPATTARGKLVSGEEAIVCGLNVARAVFEAIDEGLLFDALAADGAIVSPSQILARVSGSARSILTAERTALNLLQHLSGIATLTARAVELTSGTKAKIFDTRKTTPGLRLLEKYAVAQGGGCNHRTGLFDGLLIKDNHIALAGGITRAVESVRKEYGDRYEIEVEIETLEQVSEALGAGAGIIMLDNMSTETMRRAVQLIGGRAIVEASGGIGLDRVEEIAGTGVDRISMGVLTSGGRVDISMETDL